MYKVYTFVSNKVRYMRILWPVKNDVFIFDTKKLDDP